MDARRDGPQPDRAGLDGQRPEAASSEARAADAGKLDPPKPDAAKPDAAKPDAAKLDASKLDAPKPDLGACAHPVPIASCAEGWCKIPAGCFSMGSPSSEPCRDNFEDQHQVTLTHGFEIGQLEVTQSEFQLALGYNPSGFPGCQGCPVESMTWHEAARYANAVSTQKQKPTCYVCTGSGPTVSCSQAFVGASIYSCPGYRLPTEAEWEYAYRAGTKSAYYNGPITSCSGSDPNASLIGWYIGNASGKPTTGGKKLANAWGSYDLAGNVFELVNDYYGFVISTAPAIDPWGGNTGTYRVVRGGSWLFAPPLLRAAARNPWLESSKRNDVGFRLARTLP